MDPIDYDVVVIGAGGAGLAAAVAAAQAGASVLVLEAGKQVGGSTALAGGSFMAAGTGAQRELGFHDDTPDALFDYYLACNQWSIEPSVVRQFCDEGVPTMNWLRELGVRFTADGLYRSGLEPAPRSHRAVGGGRAYIDALIAACGALDVDVAVDNRVEELLVEETRVVGTVARGAEVRAHAVVLASGGFGANRSLIAAHYPDADAAGDRVWSPCPATNRGDGIQLARSAGASMAGANHGDVLLTAGVTKDLEPYPPGWLVYVDRHGRRFVDESASYAVMTRLFRDHGGSAWCVFDEASRLDARADPSSQFGAGTWVADTIEVAAKQGAIRRAETVDELARLMAVNPRGLWTTVERYNIDCATGRDTQFFKHPDMMKPIVTPPFYGAELWPAVVVVTAYGPRIDARAAVLDEDNRPIPGLFGAGEVTGNVLGEQYLGGGNALGSALIFGRLAGLNAAAAST
jgi:fumarate reductase flavoprotein subunit